MSLDRILGHTMATITANSIAGEEGTRLLSRIRFKWQQLHWKFGNFMLEIRRVNVSQDIHSTEWKRKDSIWLLRTALLFTSPFVHLIPRSSLLKLN